MIFRVWIEIHVEAESRAGACVKVEELYRDQRLASKDIVRIEDVPENPKATQAIARSA